MLTNLVARISVLHNSAIHRRLYLQLPRVCARDWLTVTPFFGIPTARKQEIARAKSMVSTCAVDRESARRADLGMSRGLGEFFLGGVEANGRFGALSCAPCRVSRASLTPADPRMNDLMPAPGVSDHNEKASCRFSAIIYRRIRLLGAPESKSYPEQSQRPHGPAADQPLGQSGNAVR